MDLSSYDKIIVFFSGGKDSLACLLHIITLPDYDVSKVELWHHNVDGSPDEQGFMDWPVTKAYCQAVANHFGLPIYFSWKEGGFKREMLRDQEFTAPVSFQTPHGMITVGGTSGKKGTRQKFPQVSADLSVRWCSAYLKIDVARIAIRNQGRFRGIRTLTISGERAEESAARSKYKTFEPDGADLRNGKKYQRHVDRWRPIHGWSEADVWGIIEEFRINPHPAYKLGYSRVSCMHCIFGNADQWATGAELDPDGILQIAEYENDFGVTIKRSEDVLSLVGKGRPYALTDTDRVAAMSEAYTDDIVLGEWKLPPGAYGESCGPS